PRSGGHAALFRAGRSGAQRRESELRRSRRNVRVDHQLSVEPRDRGNRAGRAGRGLHPRALARAALRALAGTRFDDTGRGRPLSAARRSARVPAFHLFAPRAKILLGALQVEIAYALIERDASLCLRGRDVNVEVVVPVRVDRAAALLADARTIGA